MQHYDHNFQIFKSSNFQIVMYLDRALKIMNRINELASISEDEQCITRTFGTKAFMEGSRKVLSWMKSAGLEPYIDNIGNVRGKLKSHNPSAKTFVIAS